MLNMPSVATNGGSLNRVMTMPLNQPSAAPTAIAARIAPEVVNSINKSVPGTANPFVKAPAATAPENASIEPTDRSMPPDRMIIVMPMDRQRLTQICRSTFNPLSTVKKLVRRQRQGRNHQAERQQRLEFLQVFEMIVA